MLGASTRAENDDRLVIEDDPVVSDWNDVPGGKSSRSGFSSKVALGIIEFRSIIEGGSGYIL